MSTDYFPLPKGEIPLVARVESADIMATLLKLKVEVENTKNSTIKLVFSGATEAHLLIEDIGNTSPECVPGAD